MLDWLERGAPALPQAELPAALQAEQDAWERFLNGDSTKERLVARYIYEHLFLATLYLDAGQPDRTLALPHRSDAECLADELRRLDPDEVYSDALTQGVSTVRQSRRTASEAVRAGEAPSPSEAERTTTRLRRAARAAGGSRMVEEMDMPEEGTETETVKQASADRLAEVKERRS